MIVSFKFYVMNFVEIVIEFYSHITSHVSQVFASCTHYTSYSLLNLVHDIVCEFVLAIQDYMFLDFMQNMFNVWVVEDKLIQKCVFGRFGLNTSVFEKHFISYSCILFIKYYALRSFCIKLLYSSKFWFFQIFNRSKNSTFFNSSFSLTRLVFDRYSTDWNWKNFSF